jgi:hypothetical protein
MRDRQISDLKEMKKPSDVFRSLFEVMESMQLDLANFMITQIRPSLINNCVIYERKKFSNWMEMQYKLRQDPLRITHPWILRHVIDDRPPLIVIGKAFGELLNWKGDWPEVHLYNLKINNETMCVTFCLLEMIFLDFNSRLGSNCWNCWRFEEGNISRSCYSK